MENKTKDAEVEYPREWEFCIFGKDKEKMKNAIDECIPEKLAHKDSKSHKKFHSQKVKVFVNNEEERNSLYGKLQNHPEILYIL